jgi:hypothetical protein
MTGTWASGWATNDLVSAAEFKKGMGAIYDTTLGVAAASIDVSGIVSSYAHLLVVIQDRSDAAVANTTRLIRFNNDSGANYDGQVGQFSAATPSASESFGATSGFAGDMPAATATASVFAGTSILIPNYAGTTANKSAMMLGVFKQGIVTLSIQLKMTAIFWRSSAAINQITITPGSGNFIAGTRVTIYGMGA